MAAIRKSRSSFPRTSFWLPSFCQSQTSDDAKLHCVAKGIPATLSESRTSSGLQCWILQRQTTSTIRPRVMTADRNRFPKMVILALQEWWARAGQLAWLLSGLLLLAGLAGVVILLRWTRRGF